MDRRLWVLQQHIMWYRQLATHTDKSINKYGDLRIAKQIIKLITRKYTNECK